ncbi:MAG: ABC transporter permease [Aristaeellaceae bacterium]
MSRSKLSDTLSFCLGILLIGALVQLAGWAKGDDLVFPGVDEILRAFGRLVTTGRTYQLIWTTIRHLLLSMAVSTVIGIALGIAQGLFRFVRNLLQPTMIFLRSLPMIVLIIIVMVLVKKTYVPVIATSVMIVPIISEATCEGCLRIDRELIDVYRMNSSFNLRVLMQVYLPLMAGYLRQAYVNAVGMGVKLVVTTEYIVQTMGSLGKAVYDSSFTLEYQDIYAYALIMILLVLLVSEAPVALGRFVSRVAHKVE